MEKGVGIQTFKYIQCMGCVITCTLIFLIEHAAIHYSYMIPSKFDEFGAQGVIA